MIKRIDHVAVAVRNTEEALRIYKDTLGLKIKRSEEVPDQGVKATLIEIGDTEIGLPGAYRPPGGSS